MIDPSAIQHVEIQNPDFVGRQFAVVSNERVDTGAGTLNAPIMPVPTLLLGLFGTPATFYLNGVSKYDPLTGKVTEFKPTPVQAMVYPESYTLEERSIAPEILSGDIKLYVPGQAFGYTTVALLILRIRENAGVTQRIAVNP